MSKKKKGAASAPNRPAVQPGRPGWPPAIAGVALGLFVLVVIVWIWRGAHAGSPAAATAASPSATATASLPPFPGASFPSQGHAHLDPAAKDDFVYNSNPPTSGPHKELFTGQFISPNPLPVYIQVHLLEHGNVLLQYSCMCPDVASSLSSIAFAFDAPLIAPSELAPSVQEVQQGEEEGKAVIVAPYPHMKARIALTAWTRLATLQSVDKSKIDSFIDLYLTNEVNAAK